MSVHGRLHTCCCILTLIVFLFRNIYYHDPSLFKKQAVVDRYVDALALTFGVQRANLNVVSHRDLAKNIQFAPDRSFARQQQRKVWF